MRSPVQVAGCGCGSHRKSGLHFAVASFVGARGEENSGAARDSASRRIDTRAVIEHCSEITNQRGPSSFAMWFGPQVKLEGL
jgi:hypothetical protein